MLLCQGGCNRKYEEYYILTDGRVFCNDCWRSAMDRKDRDQRMQMERQRMFQEKNMQIKNLEDEIRSNEWNPEYRYKRSDEESEWYADTAKMTNLRNRLQNEKANLKEFSRFWGNSNYNLQNPKWYTKEEAKHYELYELPRIKQQQEEKERKQKIEREEQERKWKAQEETQKRQKADRESLISEISTSSNQARLRQLFATNRQISKDYFLQNPNTPSDVLEMIYKYETESGYPYISLPVLEHKNAPHKLFEEATNKNWNRNHTLVSIRNCRNTPLHLKKRIQDKFDKEEREQEKRENGCYIATACYGNYDCVQVLTFRNFRDEYLSQTIAGRIFIKIYYALSPSLAKWLENQHRINTFIREKFLDKIYDCLKKKY